MEIPLTAFVTQIQASGSKTFDLIRGIELFIPFLLSLITIWIKDDYTRRQEVKNKTNYLWSILGEKVDECREYISNLNETFNYFQKKKVVFFGLDIPKTLTDYAKRLAELERKQSFLYSDYASKVEILRTGHASLQRLLSEAAFQNLDDENTFSRIITAISSQIDALKKDSVILAKTEYRLVQFLEKKYHSEDRSIADRWGAEIDKIGNV
ncbi:hypothetical protein [Pedobacter sp. SYSU D00535]|uniref:hypothetical protein n=1 Tax=Pedobacter sp. SYSU D00535 TaxID=2810308 RepID=UPI001A956FD3|nr:hypothetical protein [Pedobacter sp. SYSU D00535]